MLHSSQKPKTYLTLNGVRLTKTDEEKQYIDDTLGDVIADQHGRHVARVAHLYFARMMELSKEDYADVMNLIKKTFGNSSLSPASESGWLGACLYLPDCPKSVYEEMQRDLESLFEENKKWSNDHLRGFRVLELLHPLEEHNLFSVLFDRKPPNDLYFFPMNELPARSAKTLEIWRSGTADVYVPKLYLEICAGAPETLNNQRGQILVKLPDYYILRFLNWFAGPIRKSSTSHNNHQHHPSKLSKGVANIVQPVLPSTLTLDLDHLAIRRAKPSNFSSSTLFDVTQNSIPFEILYAYLQTFIPLRESPIRALSPRYCQVFSWAVCELWLGRIKIDPNDVDPQYALTKQLLNSLFLLFVHCNDDPKLRVDDMSVSEAQERFKGRAGILLGVTPILETFRVPVYQFFSYWFGEASFEGEASLDHVIDLWTVCLTPWRNRKDAKPHLISSSLLPSSAHAHSLTNTTTTTTMTTEGNSNSPFSKDYFWFVVQNYYLFVDLFHRVMDRLDGEGNPSLESLEAIVRAFQIFSLPVMALLFAIENIYHHESIAPLSHCFDPFSREISSMASQKVMLIQQSLQQQFTDFSNRQVSKRFRDVNMESFLRQLLHNRHVVYKEKAASSLAFLSARPKDDSDIDLICQLFNLHKGDFVKQAQVMGRAAHTSDHHFHLPEVTTRLGVPSWLGYSSAVTRAKFRALTDLGRKQLREGEREASNELAAQYLGDYSSRPLESWEIALFAYAAIRLNRLVESHTQRFVDFRVLADVRNLLLVMSILSVLDVMFWKASHSFMIAYLCVYALVVVNLRGVSSLVCHLTFLSLFIYLFSK